jgi:hypothetical protein
MPWREVSFMDQRKEFVRLFQQPDVNRRELRALLTPRKDV